MTDTATTIRVAVPSELPGGLQAQRSGHFGRCASFTVADVTGGQIGDVRVLVNGPHEHGGCMAPVVVLADDKVDAVVVGGIGGRPLMGLRQAGIAVHAGAGATVEDALRAFAGGDAPAVGLEGACQH
jgi:predicted Fe-Mo cluster-binding NifX family protein